LFPRVISDVSFPVGALFLFTSLIVWHNLQVVFFFVLPRQVGLLLALHLSFFIFLPWLFSLLRVAFLVGLVWLLGVLPF
jgi:hypothetical protein